MTPAEEEWKKYAPKGRIINQVIDNICPNNFIFWQKLVNNIILRHLISNFILLLLFIKQFQYHWDIFFLHGPNITLDLNSFSNRKPVLFFKILAAHVLWKVAIPDVKQLLGVDESVHVMTCGKRCGHRMSGSIISLGKSIQPLSPHHFLNHNLRKPLFSQLLMDS